MSDLQCAATLLIARPAETEPQTDRAAGESAGLSIGGRHQARRLAGELESARVAMIYCSDVPRAVQTAEILAATLGVHVRVREALHGAYDGESPGDVLDRTRSELEAIADQHRGETVLVVSHGDVIALVVPRVAGLPAGHASEHWLGTADVLEVAVDADGWVVRSRGGDTPPRHAEPLRD